MRSFFTDHPRIAGFLALAAAMVGVAMLASKDAPLDAGQRVVLAASTVLLAGLCVWIVHWE